MNLPLPGTFIRPVGARLYLYCYRVLEDISGPENLFPCVKCERWGMIDKAPVDDGRVLAGHMIHLVPVRPDVWMYPHLPGLPESNRRWNEIYFVAISSAMKYDQRGQGMLF